MNELPHNVETPVLYVLAVFDPLGPDLHLFEGPHDYLLWYRLAGKMDWDFGDALSTDYRLLCEKKMQQEGLFYNFKAVNMNFYIADNAAALAQDIKKLIYTKMVNAFNEGK